MRRYPIKVNQPTREGHVEVLAERNLFYLQFVCVSLGVEDYITINMLLNTSSWLPAESPVE